MQISNNDYQNILENCIQYIHQARNSLAKKLNAELMGAYEYIGRILSEKQLNEGYGSGIVNRLSSDLKSTFPDMGLSPRNLWDMKRFYERYKEASKKLRQTVAVLPWGHNLLILNKTHSEMEALFYATVAMEQGFSRNALLNYIKMGAFDTQYQLSKSHNFEIAMPHTLAIQADEILKSSYNLGFLGITHPLKERELEKRLVEKVKQFILELGKGFTFIGNQYRLEYNGKEYFIEYYYTI